MTIPRFFVYALAICGWAVNAALVRCQPPAEASIKVRVEKESALYKVGETASFIIEAKPLSDSSGKETVACIFSEDGFSAMAPRKVELVDGKAKLTGSLDHPGFLQLKVVQGKTTALASAGFSPETIPPSRPVPDDFQAFWDAQKQKLAAVPVKPTLESVKSPVAGVEAFDVKVDCLGAPTSGYFGRPKDAKPKSLPAILFVHGAGVRSSNLGSVNWCLREGGMLAMDINAHGIPNGQPDKYYEDLSKGELKDYRSVGRDDREACYFKFMFLRMIRAIDFLTSQPEWDGRTMIVYGSSQGGFQALAAAGLDSRVSFICAGVPAGCDHTGSAANRISGWPKIVPIDAQGKPDAKVLEAARYVDCVNFASLAKCKGAAVTVGLIDTTCPPTSVYAAYNALPCPKSIHVDPLTGHTSTPAAGKFMQEAALKHVRDQKANP